MPRIKLPTIQMPGQCLSLALIAASAALYHTGTACAQTLPAQPPAGGLPAAEPFNIPYGMPVSLQGARVALQAAQARAARRGWPEAIAVTDPAGMLVAFERQDDSPNAAAAIAVRKASAAARFRHDTRTFYNAFEGGHVTAATLDPTLVASPGGIPLLQDGRIVGAIGCSGGTGDQDADVCQAGADALH